MAFPVVWRAVHAALMELKDEQIALLRAELTHLRAEVLRADQQRDHAIAQLLDRPEPAEVKPRRQAPPTLDLALVDPSDNQAIRDLALSEMPAGKANASLLLAKMENIRSQVRAAHQAKAARAREVGSVRTEVPQSVQDQIDAAMATGREQARAQ